MNRSYKQAIQNCSFPLEHSKDLDPLMDRIGDARLVLLGEASHGTHEYYTWRTAISKRLIEEKKFNFIAVEGDWPDCYRINRFIKNYDGVGDKAVDVLNKFDRWPTWMWANWEVAAFTEWIKSFNLNKNTENDKQVGFYGLDVYSLWDSMQAIMQFLKKRDPDSLEAAKLAYSCFEPYGNDDGVSYARAVRFTPDDCREEVIDLLSKIRNNGERYDYDDEAVFSSQINALVAVNAEKYYRTMLKSSSESWNIRDRHMSEVVDQLMNFYGDDSKAIIWAHNTHIGDARATNMAHRGMLNIGQLVREKYRQENAVLVGFGSYQGAVIAGSGWGEPMRVMPVPPAQDGTFEHALHQMDNANRLLIFNDAAELKKPIEHRAIGVVYNSEHERFGNYVPSKMSNRYDAFLYLDQSFELHPLHYKSNLKKVPDTYPFNF